jgi:hypothetical protein
MPYVTEKRKRELREFPPTTAGDLTYLIQQQLKGYLSGRSVRYEDLAVCLGALEGARVDLVERMIKPYEAGKLAQNGDVWPERMLP